MLLAETLVLFAGLLGELDFLLRVKERVDHAHGARGVEDVDDRVLVAGRDLDGGVRAAGRRARR